MRQSVLFLALLLAACADEKPREAKFEDALPSIPAPPDASIVNRESGEDAIKVRFASPAGVDSVASYYRELLSKEPYTLVSDTKLPDQGGVALYAEQPGKPSLWVTITPAAGSGSLVDVAGAKDRTKRQ